MQHISSDTTRSTSAITHLGVEVHVVGHGVAQSQQGMCDDLLQRAVGKLAQVLLQVGARRLRAGSDGHRLTVEVVGRWTGLVDVRTGLL